MSVDLDKLNETINNLQALRSTLRKQAQEAIKASFQDFLTAYPQVKCVVWTQYTPYFNDGDECVFRVNDLTFCPADTEDPHGEDYEDENERSFYTSVRYDYQEVPNPRYGKQVSPYYNNVDNRKTINERVPGSEKYDPRTTPEMRKAMNKMQMLTSDDMEDAMRQAFGNHVWVKAYLKDGKVEFDVNDYEHD